MPYYGDLSLSVYGDANTHARIRLLPAWDSEHLLYIVGRMPCIESSVLITAVQENMKT